MEKTSVAHRFVTLAERISERLRLPRVRAFHLPPQGLADSKGAEFCAVELDDGSVGLTYLWRGETLQRMHADLHRDDIEGQAAIAVARGYAMDDPLARAIGFAAINALSQQLFARAGWLPTDAADSLGQVQPKSGEHIGMIGLFPPLVRRITAAGARLTVLELDPRLAGDHDGFRVTLDPRDMAGCRQVVSTCTVLINDTLDAVLQACHQADYLAIVGPTAGCVADPLFDRGVRSIGGRRITDVDGFRDALRAGEKWGKFSCKYSIAPQDYPGIDTLLART
jgi:uncharacterized protein